MSFQNGSETTSKRRPEICPIKPAWHASEKRFSDRFFAADAQIHSPLRIFIAVAFEDASDPEKTKKLKIHKKFTFSNFPAFQNGVLFSFRTWHIRRQKSGSQNLISALILRNLKIPENPRRSRLFRYFVDNTRLLVAFFVEK